MKYLISAAALCVWFVTAPAAGAEYVVDITGDATVLSNLEPQGGLLDQPISGFNGGTLTINLGFGGDTVTMPPVRGGLWIALFGGSFVQPFETLGSFSFVGGSANLPVQPIPYYREGSCCTWIGFFIPDWTFGIREESYSFQGMVLTGDITPSPEAVTFTSWGVRYSQGEFWDPENSIVPEPATWAMLIAGFGLVGAAMRRRRLTAAPPEQ